SADQPSPATVNEVIAEAAAPATAGPVRFFELEDAPGQVQVHAEGADTDTVSDAPAVGAPGADVADVVAPDVLDIPAPEDSADTLDFSVYDRELVDIFVEEGKDLLDHCDGLISELRDAPQDREVLAGLQRDLHTLKGGARMAGINAIGDLGHSIESLLEAVAAGRTEIERRDVQLLERGFDRLHQLLTRTGNHRVVEPAQDLVDAFEVRT
ncbi:Hpt domain-containing protein, partial [Stenotrophomonas maltophilia]|nr:Hpt domain-containing protein [Stenotrophomonas maltophilia]